MKEKDNIDQLFERLEGNFDVHEAPANHQRRFLDKLEQTSQDRSKNVTSRNWWKPLSIAASLLLLVAVGLNFNSANTAPQGLASVSPEMEQTESFFTKTINKELETLKSFETEDSKKIIEDTMKSMSSLEKEYEQLKLDLTTSGNDKRVITAMINNFQNRIEILEQVISTIEEIKTLKANKNETIL